MIYRRKTRVIQNSTEITSKTDSIGASDAVSIALTTSDALYLGFHKPFACRYFVLGTVNSIASALAITRWNGSTWEAVEDIVDQTVGFTSSGWVSWKNSGTWSKYALTPVTDEELYWIRIKVSVNLHASTTLRAVLNLFCDAVLLREYFPELVADTKYLPTGRSDFYEQFLAGKNMTVQELLSVEKIEDESQILNPEEVSIAATFASAYCILNGVRNPSEELIERKKDIRDDFEFWISRCRISVDSNSDGEIDEAEEARGTEFFVRR